MRPVDLRGEPYDAKFRRLRKKLAGEPSYMTVFSKVDRVVDRVTSLVYSQVILSEYIAPEENAILSRMEELMERLNANDK
jgi:hypothetical protein